MAGPPNLTYGQVPTAAQWNQFFAQKQDALGYTPVNRAGDTMTGPLKLSPSTIANAPLNIAPGTAPGVPVNGDIWTTNTGLFAQIAGETLGPIRSGDMSGPEVSVANNIATFADITGGVLEDSGVSIDDVVQTSREITVGDGLTGGGFLSGDVGIALSSETIASLGAADSAMQPATYDPSGQQENIYDQTFRNDSPSYYGAAGNGTTDDLADYRLTEDAVSTVYLPNAKIYNLGSEMPLNAVRGLGQLRIDGDDLGGYSLGQFVPIDSFVYNPSATYLVNGRSLPRIYPPNPPLGDYRQYHNAIITIGSNFVFDGPGDSNPYVIRSTAFGTFNGVQIAAWNRVDAFGHCSFMFSEYAERSAAIGSDSMPWGGITSRQVAIDTAHNFYANALPNTPEWATNPASPGYTLEPEYPGIGQRIWDYATYSSEEDTFKYNTGLGRDTGANIVYGRDNTFAGYFSAAYMYAGSGNVAIGVASLQNSVFGNDMVAIGYRAGRDIMDGQNTIFIGKDAGLNIKSADNSIFIGFNAGNGLPDDQDGVLVINNQYTGSINPLISGAFYDAVNRTNPGVGINIRPKDIKNASLHVQFGSALSGILDPADGAAGILISRGGDTGLSIATPAANKGAIFFADPGGNDRGGMMYDHNVDRLYLRSGSVYRMQLGSGGLWIKDAMKSSDPGAGSKELWYDPANGNTIKYAV